MVLGLLDQLQIFWQLYLIELLGFLTGLGLQVLQHMLSKAFDRVWHAGLLHKRKSYGISSQIFGLISFFLGNRRLRVVLDGVSSQEYPLMTFPMISVILLSMLMILLFTLTVIRHRLCGNN